MTMLEELKGLKFPGTKDFIIFVLQSIADHADLSVDDLKILCSYAPGQYQLGLEALLLYCKCLGFITVDGGLSVTPELQNYTDSVQLNRCLVEKTVGTLFIAGIFRPNMFSFDITTHNFLFRNEMLPLAYASLRNILVSQGFFVVNRFPSKTIFYVNTDYEILVSSFCKKHKKTMTLQQLQKQLEQNEIAGEKAEKLVLEYEKCRLGVDLGARVKIISSIDVGAGYDIVSFDAALSVDYDRFIEVKAASLGDSFYWSSSEYETARLKGKQYYLYLVDLRKIKDKGYIPTIIQDPAHSIMKSEEWLVESQSYHIRRIKV